MDEPAFSEQIQHFIRDHISSVAQLEILLLLQTNPQQRWKPHDIARELRIEAAGAQGQLDLLCATGLVRREPAEAAAYMYMYAPASPELQMAAIAVAQAYLVRRVSLIGLIFAKPSEPPSSLKAFSDAFRLRKGPDDLRR